MEKENKSFGITVIAILNVTILSVGQAYNSRIAIAGAILLFCTLLLYNYKQYFLPLILFYLPWSSMLRFDPQQSSFHTLVVPVIFLILLTIYIKKQNNFSKNYFAFAIIITSYTIIIKFTNDLSLDTAYIFFIIMLFFIPLYIEICFKKLRFDLCIIFLGIGNITACIASSILITNSNVLRYIDINKEMLIGLRLSGFYGDPNYFSAQILVAIVGLLIILTKVKNKKLILPIVIMVTALCYFALQSVSKMFILCLLTAFFLWLFNLLISRLSLGYKIGIVVTFVAIVTIVIVEHVFMKEIDFYLMRFGKVKNSVSLTTGRVILWRSYIDYLLQNPNKLFFGIGVSEDQVQHIFRINNVHMTAIQTIYQLGVTGTAMFLLWWKSVYDAARTKPLKILSDFTNMLILSVAIFLPWLALDMLYFREFFYFVLVLFLLKKYITEDQEGTSGDDDTAPKVYM